MPATTTYNTLEEIQQRKEELKTDLHLEGQKMSDLWHGLFLPQQASSKGELVANLVSNSITAIDAFLLVRKLMKTYGNLFHRKHRKG